MSDAPTPLHDAAAADDCAAIARLLRDGADINARTRDGVTPLVMATSRGNAAAAKQLILAGADVKIRATDGLSALLGAADYGLTEIVRLLLARGARPEETQCATGHTALTCAMQKGHTEIESLLRLGKPQRLSVELANAIAADSGQAARKILTKHRDLARGLGKDGYSAIHQAANRGATDVLGVLLEFGADVNARGPGERTPLHIAAAASQWYAAEILLEHGAEVNATTNGGKTAFDLAVDEHVHEILRKRGGRFGASLKAGAHSPATTSRTDNAGQSSAGGTRIQEPDWNHLLARSNTVKSAGGDTPVRERIARGSSNREAMPDARSYTKWLWISCFTLGFILIYVLDRLVFNNR